MNMLLRTNLDFIFFCYGFISFMLAGIAFVIWRMRRDQVAWIGLALSSLFTGCCAWLALAVVYTDNWPIIEGMRSVLRIGSYLAFFYFGCASLDRYSKRNIGRMVFLLWTVATLIVWIRTGLWEGEMPARIMLGFVGGLVSSVSLFVAVRMSKEPGTFWLKIASGLLALYAFTMGPALIQDNTTVPAIFKDVSVFPVQIFRMVISYCVVFSLGYYWLAFYSLKRKAFLSMFKKDIVVLQTALFCAFLGGFWLVQNLGHNEDPRNTREAVDDAIVLSRDIRIDAVKKLSGTPADLTLPEYKEIQEQLDPSADEDADIDYLAVLGLRDGKLRVLASSKMGDPSFAVSWNSVIQRAAPQLEAAFRDGKLFKLGPMPGRITVTAFVPIIDPNIGGVVAVLTNSVRDNMWLKNIFFHRLPGLLATLLLWIGIIAGFLITLVGKGAEIIVVESEDRLRKLFKQIPEAICIFDEKTGEILEANRSLVNFLGYGYTELMAMNIDSLLTSSKGLAKRNRLKTVFFQTKDKRNLAVVLQMIRLEYRDQDCMLVNLQDNIERHKWEKAIQEREQYYRALLENTMDIINIIDIKGTILYANAATRMILGYAPEDLMGKNSFDYIDRAEHPRLMKVIAEGVLSGEVRTEVFRFKHKDGTWRTMEAQGRSYLHDPTIRGIVINSRDITNRRKILYRMHKLNSCFIGFGTDFDKNIAQLVRALGEALEVDAALYRRWEEGKDVPVSCWKVEHACDSCESLMSELTLLPQNSTDAAHVFYDPGPGLEIRSDSMALPAGFKTYVQKTVGTADHAVGVLILLTKREYILDAEDSSFLDIITSAINTEEQRRQTAEHIKKLQRQQDILLTEIPDMVWFKDIQSRFIECNKALANVWGRKKEDIIGHTDLERWPDLGALYQADDRRVMETRQRMSIEETITDPQGKSRWIETIKSPVIDDRGVVIGTVGIARDITERKMDEEKIEKLATDYQMLFDQASYGIVLVDGKDMRIIMVNPAICVMSGYSREEMLQMNILDTYPASERKEAQILGSTLQKGEVRTFERNWLKKNGEIFVAAVDLLLRPDGIFQGFIQDLSLQKEARDELLRLTQAIEQSPVSVVITDTKGNIEYVNPKFTQVTGYAFAEVLGKNPRFLKSGETKTEGYKNLWDTITAGGEWRGIFHNKRKDGTLFWEAVSISPVRTDNGKIAHFVAIKEDITERRAMEGQLEAVNEALVQREKALLKSLSDLERAHTDLQNTQRQLIQSEKLAAIGQLAAGIAHEINNPIGYINSNLEMFEKYSSAYLGMIHSIGKLKNVIAQNDLTAAQEIVRQLTAYEEKVNLEFINRDIEDMLRESKAGIERIKRIVLDLRTFSRVSQDTMDLANIEDVLDGVINIVWNELKYKVELKKEYGRLPLIKCDAQRMGQVFLNILVNAAQAIKDKGTLTVKTYLKDAWVFVAISDTGEGIPPDIMPKIFSPFFTTKPIGQGTGLGLSISYDIVRLHGGKIEVASEVGKGTTFTVILPLNSSEQSVMYEKK